MFRLSLSHLYTLFAVMYVQFAYFLHSTLETDGKSAKNVT